MKPFLTTQILPDLSILWIHNTLPEWFNSHLIIYSDITFLIYVIPVQQFNVLNLFIAN